jgi:hypothetical protein
MHQFNNVGLYDGLFVMQDTETKTLWNHITGEALYGPLVGRTLGPLGNVRQTNVKQALAAGTNVRVAISDRVYFAGGRQFGTASGFGPGRGPVPGRGAARGGAVPGRGPGAGRGSAGPNPNAQLSPMFIETLGKEDTRRPRMDMGLGVWTSTTRRYYPMELIRQRGEVFIDEIDGRKLLVYVDPETFTPAALFVNSASARLQDKEVRLDNGEVVRSGALLDARGRRRSAEQPQQVFTRWYGFALTFPGTEVFGQ